MPLENNIKIISSINIKDKISVNVLPRTPMWTNLSAGDEYPEIWQLDEPTSFTAYATGTANVKRDTIFDFSSVDNTTPGTYPVRASFEGMVATYDITVKQVTMEIIASDYTDLFYEGETVEFDGVCTAHYNRPHTDKKVEPIVTYPDWHYGKNTVRLDYHDDYYNLDATTNIYIDYLPEPDENTYICDLTQIEDFDQWTSAYVEHELIYDDVTIDFTGANRQESVITDIPVVRGAPVLISTDNDCRYFNKIYIKFRQWQQKAQTVYLDYSMNGGDTWVESIASTSNFEMLVDIPEEPNMLRLRFSSATNQIGVETVVLYTNLEDEPIHRLVLSVPELATVEEPFEAWALCNVPGDQFIWSCDDETVDLEENNDSCLITAHEVGSINITVQCQGMEQTKPVTITGSSVEVVEFAFNSIYSADAELNNVTLDLADGDIQVSFAKDGGSSAPVYKTSGSAARLYAKNQMTFTCNTSGEISSIEFTISQDKDMSANVGTYIKPNWVGSNSQIIFTISDGGGHIRIQGFKVKYS